MTARSRTRARSTSPSTTSTSAACRRGGSGGQAGRQLRLHQGRQGRSERDFLFSGITEVLKPAMDAGKIKNVGEVFTDGWKPDNAQKNMEQLPHQEQQQGRRGRLRERRHGRRRRRRADGAGHGRSVPGSGQDGDHAAINRVALGTQTVSVWKDSRDLGKQAGEAAFGSPLARR